MVDLRTFQQRFKCFAQVRRNQVVVDLGGVPQEQHPAAKAELIGIIRHNLQTEPTEVTLDSLEDTRSNSRLVTTTLRVSKSAGAGLDLVPENGGMRIESIVGNPPQPDLQPGDLIVRINDIPLVGTVERVEATFGENFQDGACISVKRTCA